MLGENCEAVGLKRMDLAQTYADHVSAVIRVFVVPQDRKSARLTAPNGRALQNFREEMWTIWRHM